MNRCARCGVGICATCDFLLPGVSDSNSILRIGTPDIHVCPGCAAIAGRRAAGVAAPFPGPPAMQAPVIALGSGLMCAWHPGVEAVRRCHVCHAFMCQTCDFEFPGNFHACPTCATNPKREMGSKRKRNLIISYVLAAWTTVALIATFAGTFAGLVSTKEDREVLGLLMTVLVIAPALVGIAMSVGSIDRKLGTPAAVWGAVVWNAITVTVLLMLIVVGNLK